MAELIDLGGVSQTPAPHPAATSRRKNASNSTLPISDIFFLTLRKWPWILVSLTLCMGAAIYYVLKTPTVYTRSAQLMIKDSSSSKSANVSEIADFGLISTKTDIENEIINLRSGELMAEVVRRLDLDVEYYREGRFHNVVAYGANLPVRLRMIEPSPSLEASLTLNVTADGKVLISDIKSNGQTYPETIKGALNDTINTPIGPVTVVPADAFSSGNATKLEVHKLPAEYAQGIYSGHLSVGPSSEKSSLIRLTMTDRSPERADDVLGTLIEVYKDSWIKDKNEIAVYTSQFINERLGVIESELGNVDQDISSYKSENLITDPASISSMYMSQNQQLASEMQELNNQIQLARLIRNSLSSDVSKSKLLPVNPGIVGDVAQQISEYNDMVLRRNNLVEKSSETNPLVTSIDGQLQSLRAVMLSSIDNQITALNTRLASCRATLGATISKIATGPSQTKYLLSVERQQKVKEALYLFLLQKREENELSQAFTAYNTRVINAPGPAGVPPTPDKSMILVMAGLVGLALPFGVTFLTEMTNTTIRGRKDIDHLNIPFLGEIPQETSLAHDAKKGRQKDVSSLVVKEGARDIINEAFRVLRTNVEFMSKSTSGANVIAMTSFNPGSGKSFISVNLGATIALKGKNVLVIDGDMRHGSTSSYVGSPTHGLSNYLNTPGTDINSLIVNDPQAPNLYVLPIGPIPPNPTELLESARLQKLIDELRPQFDYIFIDCPPIEIVADTQIIDSHVDRTIFIVRAGLLQREMLPELERIYEEKKYRNMALILNGTPLSKSRYAYGHGYGKGYAYDKRENK